MYQHIGRHLKEVRESQGISLRTVQEKTKVSLRYLQAIESGAMHVIPGEFYLRGFIRSYARAVGVNPDELFAAYAQRPAAPNHHGRAKSPGLFARVAHGLRHGLTRRSHRYN